MPENDTDQGLPAQASEKPSAKYTTRELGRLLKFYKEKVRDYSVEESRGVIRNIQRLIDKGICLEDIATALDNYANDEWRKSQDPRYTLSLRSFFSESKVKEWQHPRQPMKPVRQGVPEIKLVATYKPPPAAPVQPQFFQEEDDYEL